MVNVFLILIILILLGTFTSLVVFNWDILISSFNKYKKDDTACSASPEKKSEGKKLLREKSDSNTQNLPHEASPRVDTPRPDFYNEKVTCPSFDITKNGCQSNKYILKSSIKACSPLPPLTKYIVKEKCPKCPTCQKTKKEDSAYNNNFFRNKPEDFDWIPVETTDKVSCQNKK
jgi:hypothetical protein